MARLFYFVSLLLSVLCAALFYYGFHAALWVLVFSIPYALVGLYDLTSRHNILRNYPVIGHLRYMLESIRPEIQQYFIRGDLEEKPYCRELRSHVYALAKGLQNAHPFGTQQLIDAEGYHFAQHALAVKKVPPNEARLWIGQGQCAKPYYAARLNISAMSYGALSANAVLALNRGARHGGFAHNTGEGGISPYHLQEQGDLIWQIGTAYFGCRTANGDFCEQQFAQKAALDNVKMIEIKLSQGAKPAHGGILPAAKVNKSIAEIRGVAVAEACISPPAHTAFNTPMELIKFIGRLRQLSGAKPVGFKLCVGAQHEFLAICKAMLALDIVPDFITIDGAEGGTGAAPVEFSNRLGTPLYEALIFVHQALLGCNLRARVRLIASAKISTGFDMLMALALGADACNMARPMMFALGCIQSQRCHTNHCPTGVATQNKWRQRALVVSDKYLRVSRYQAATMQSCLELLGAIGCSSVAELTPSHIYRRDADGASVSYADLMPPIQVGSFLRAAVPSGWQRAWYAADRNSFVPYYSHALSSSLQHEEKQHVVEAV